MASHETSFLYIFMENKDKYNSTLAELCPSCSCPLIAFLRYSSGQILYFYYALLSSHCVLKMLHKDATKSPPSCFYINLSIITTDNLYTPTRAVEKEK